MFFVPGEFIRHTSRNGLHKMDGVTRQRKDPNVNFIAIHKICSDTLQVLREERKICSQVWGVYQRASRHLTLCCGPPNPLICMRWSRPQLLMKLTGALVTDSFHHF